MRRLTVEAIMRAPSFRNTLHERELDLRGLRVSRIENLGVTQDQFDVIDLSNNQIETIDSMPMLKRLTTLIINNNLVSSCADSFSENVPNLRSLILTNNNINTWSSIAPLTQLTHLEHLSFFQNPITLKENYRLTCINIFPSLKYLDFQKVTEKEREEAKKIFNKE